MKTKNIIWKEKDKNCEVITFTKYTPFLKMSFWGEQYLYLAPRKYHYLIRDNPVMGVCQVGVKEISRQTLKQI